MARVLPFRGLRYGPGQARNLGRLVTPPYDIIAPDEQTKFYRRHPHNIIRLEYGQVRRTDREGNDRYTRARTTLRQWLKQGVLAVDPRPCYYLIESQYRLPDGSLRCFRGLMARVQLEPLGQGVVLPHEKTFQGPKADRFNLLRETGVSFSPVFYLYQDPGGKVRERLDRIRERTAPVLECKDWAGFQHRLWCCSEPADLLDLQARFRSKPLLIADGHHRYATALNYQKTYGEQVGAGADSVMMCLAETQDPGLSVLPVFRLVKDVPAANWDRFRRALKTEFKARPIEPASQLWTAQLKALRSRPGTLVGYLGDRGRTAALLHLDQLPQLAEKHLPAYARLDVVGLNHLILDPWLQLRPGEEKDRIQYTKDFKTVLQSVRSGAAQAAFLPGPPDLTTIWSLAKRGETMPQKSTYFLPKLITGLVMNPVNVP